MGIVTAISWGFTDFLSAKSTKTLGPVLSVGLIYITGALSAAILFSYYLIILHPYLHFVSKGFYIAIASGILQAIGSLTFFLALKYESVCIVSPLTSAYPLVTAVIAVLVFGAHLSSADIVGILLATIGIMIASGILSFRDSTGGITKGSLYSLITAVTWGLGYALLAQAVKITTMPIASVVCLTVIALSACIMLPFVKSNELISREKVWRSLNNKFVLGASFTTLIGNLALFIGIAKSTASGGAIITTVSACYPILTIILALLIFKDRVKIVRIIGAVAGIIGIALFTWG